MARDTMYKQLEQRVTQLEKEVGKYKRLLKEEREKRNRLQEKFHQLEDNYGIIMCAPVAFMAIVDTRGIVLDLNDQMAKRFNKCKNELIGAYGWDLVPPGLAQRRKSHFAKVIQSGKPVVFEDERNGTWFDNVFYPVFDNQGIVKKVALVARDITERKRLEDRIKEEEKDYRLVFERLRAMVFRMNPDLLLTVMQGAVKEITGYNKDDFIRKCLRFNNIIYPQDLDGILEDYERFQELNDQSISREYRIIRKDGQIRWVRDYIEGVFDDSGSLQHLHGLIYDISESKGKEKAAEKSEALFRHLAENIPDVFYMASPALDRMLYISPTYLKVWGRSCESLYETPKSFIDSIVAEDFESVMKAIEVSRLGYPQSVEYRIMRPDGEVRFISDRIFPVFDNGGQLNHLCGVATDITDRKRIQSLKQEEHELYEQVFEHFVDGIFILAGGRAPITKFCNGAAEQIFGFSREEMLTGKSWLFRVERDQERSSHVDLVSLVNTIQDYQHEECAFLRRDGTPFSAGMDVIPLKHMMEMPYGWVIRITDITDRREWEARLRESEERHRYLFEHAGVGIVYFSSSGEFLMLNEKAGKDLGVKAGGYFGKTVYEILDKELADYIDTRRIACVGEDSVSRSEHSFNTSSGRKSLVFLFNRIRTKGDAEVGVQMIVVDVTAERRMEQDLRDREAKLRRAQTLSRLGHFSWDLSTNARVWSESLLSIWGFSREMQPSFDEFIRMVHADDRRRVLEAIDDVLAGIGPYNVEYRIVRPDGSIAVVHSLAEVSRDDEGRATGMFGTVLDITERKHMEDALKENENLVRTLLNATPDSAFLLDSQGTILAANEAGSKTIKLQNADVLGKRIFDLIPPSVAQTRRNHFSGVCRTGQEARFQDQAEGSVFENVYCPVFESQGSVGKVAMFCKDITEKIRAEAVRKEAEEKLEEQRLLSMHSDRLRSLGEMAAGMAHELNQPLSGVRGLAEHLLIAICRGWSTRQEEIKEKLSLIVEQADRMTHIIDHVRLFSREAGKLESMQTDANEVVNSSILLIGEQLRSQGISLALDLADDLPQIFLNPFSLEEVVINLISNARDAVEERMQSATDFSPKIIIRTLTAHEHGKKLLRIQVSDNGTGISTQVLPRIFDPFFTTKQPGRGTGLGLSICKSIVEEFGGTIEVQAQTGKGTTINISFYEAGEER